MRTRAYHFDLARVIWFALLFSIIVWFWLTWEGRYGFQEIVVGWLVLTGWEGYEDPTNRIHRIAVLLGLYVQIQTNSAYAGYCT